MVCSTSKLKNCWLFHYMTLHKKIQVYNNIPRPLEKYFTAIIHLILYHVRKSKPDYKRLSYYELYSLLLLLMPPLWHYMFEDVNLQAMKCFQYSFYIILQNIHWKTEVHNFSEHIFEQYEQHIHPPGKDIYSNFGC